MTTLVIHPLDETTRFLDPIGAGIGATVLQGPPDGQDHGDIEGIKDWTRGQIEEHDRVIMMGHGSPNGLFGLEFPMGFIIDATMVEVLQTRENSVFIWCNADQFVLRHKLRGFFTGMFISEVTEAAYCGLKGVTQAEVTESNDAFASIVGALIQNNLPTKELHAETMARYGRYARSNQIASYNHKRLYFELSDKRRSK